ncbi:MAG: hypothetical protein J0H73_14500 [Salana multivorans]|uniref:hypothetical protein n=1 Tax=Salana multivorans TaxID=120377 RepID=UPI00096277EE|nr:hypothetical protein [Salana multivorans]MBN8883512.1 hypothetical protein [Salana multivorans]OJX96027.1 MAG: hypothetical protein BGO96_06975 [Micrococcales bacterium 73-15]
MTPHPYELLGVERVLNAADTITSLGGGPLDPRVLASMAAAATAYVDMTDYLARAGAHLAERIGVPDALVTNSAVSAVALAVAAAIAGDTPAAVDAAPAHRTDRTEVVVLCAQRNPYDRAVGIGGGRIVTAGYSDGTTRWQVEAEIGPRTAALLWYAGTQFEHYALGLADMVAIAEASGLPVIVDAAAQVPPVTNLRRYVDDGAAAVAFSGGKGLRGPQDTALLVGGDLVGVARAHAFPHYGIGRGMKVSKEGVAGLVTAVGLALDADDDADYAALLARCLAWGDALAGLPGVRTSTVPDGVLGQHTPRLRVDLDPGLGDGLQLAARLRAGRPAVVVRTEETVPGAVFLNPFPLPPEDDELVVDALRTALAGLAG